MVREQAKDFHLRVVSAHRTDEFNAVAWSPDGKLIASGSSDSTVRIWDPSSGKLLRTLEGHAYAVNSVSWSADGKALASGSSDRGAVPAFSEGPRGRGAEGRRGAGRCQRFPRGRGAAGRRAVPAFLHFVFAFSWMAGPGCRRSAGFDRIPRGDDVQDVRLDVRPVAIGQTGASIHPFQGLGGSSYDGVGPSRRAGGTVGNWTGAARGC
jgi:hypothetical protein